MATISVYSGINRVLFDWSFVVGGGNPFPVWPDGSNTFFEMPNTSNETDSSISKRWDDVSMLFVPNNGLELEMPNLAASFTWWNGHNANGAQEIYNAIDGVSTEFDYWNQYGEKAFSDFKSLRLTGENSAVPAALMTGYDVDGFSGAVNGPMTYGFFGFAESNQGDLASDLNNEGFEIALNGELRATFEI
jgi:hypothetical protein